IMSQILDSRIGKGLYDIPGIVLRRVINNDHLEVLKRLMKYAADGCRQQPRPIVSRNDDAHLWHLFPAKKASSVVMQHRQRCRVLSCRLASPLADDKSVPTDR